MPISGVARVRASRVPLGSAPFPPLIVSAHRHTRRDSPDARRRRVSAASDGDGAFVHPSARLTGQARGAVPSCAPLSLTHTHTEARTMPISRYGLASPRGSAASPMSITGHPSNQPCGAFNSTPCILPLLGGCPASPRARAHVKQPDPDPADAYTPHTGCGEVKMPTSGARGCVSAFPIPLRAPLFPLAPGESAPSAPTPCAL
ncbi:hypothetical protein HYPSUDRAFT_202727 [Hypholoma sublateritium FD-334 SS-4]|uniref:Uncharacterized protein n=1 Tax=Hypholoma sublateritium (strain FD-334 SS-4) TaxID=945553 RepID=A0A0D2L4Q8_HYPSF|nr:hypothetical protein HYPSUDRAFT_202727 [Hypholoma sublateritium FD-334 SS-4]